MSRKVIQIAVAEAAMCDANANETWHWRTTVALCDDGTIWQIRIDEEEWTRLPLVPGTKVDERPQPPPIEKPRRP